MCEAALNACWLRYHDRAMPMNWTMMRDSWATSTIKQNQFINFSKKDSINDDSSFCFHMLLAIDVSWFSFWKAFVKCLSLSVNGIFWWRQIWRHLHVTMLQCRATFSNVLIHWSIRMIRAKNYETVSTFGKVMQIKLLASFSGHGVL